MQRLHTHLLIGEPVCYDVRAFVQPEGHECFCRATLHGSNVQHSLPNTGKISQVENVMKLGRCGEHFDLHDRAQSRMCSCTFLDAYLGSLPQDPGTRDQLLQYCSDLITKSSLFAEVPHTNDTKDLVNGGVGWQRTVEDGELSFETWRNVIASSSRMDHSSYQLDVLNVCEVSWLLMAIEPSHLHKLPHNLIGHLCIMGEGVVCVCVSSLPTAAYHTNLVSPLIDPGHIDVINKYGHFPSCWGSIG